MLPLPLTLAKARRLWHQDFETQCGLMPLQVRTRTHRATSDADGNALQPPRTECYHVQPKVAPSTAKELMTDLVFMSVRALERCNRERGFEGASDGRSALSEVPALSVNCKQLGKRRSLSPRTIRTHLDRLLQMGAITRKAWHGTRANFELWINPKYVWATPQIVPKSDLDGLHIGALLQSQGTEFPLNVAFVTLETKKVEIAEGDKLGLPVGSASKRGPNALVAVTCEPKTLATQTRNTGLQLRGNALCQLADRTAGDFCPGGEGVAADPSPVSPAVRARQRRWMESFWAHAQPRLYPGCAFDNAQQRQALNAIWTGVYGRFSADYSLETWQRYHEELLERVDMVAGWLSRDLRRFLPAPFAQIVPGRGYFDQDNAQGFAQTKHWLDRKRSQAAEHRIQRTLRRAASEFRGWHRKTAPQKVLDMTMTQLYQWHLQEVQALNDQNALRTFYGIASGKINFIFTLFPKNNAFNPNPGGPKTGRQRPN